MLDCKLAGRTARRTIAALACLVAPALVPASSQAAVLATTTVAFPTTVDVGQTGVGGSITLRNLDTAPNAAAVNVVCNASDPTPPCSAAEQGIVLTPSCGQLAGDVCSSPDPGVFALAPTAAGRAGTACAGMTFDVGLVSAAAGTWGFTPQGGAHVTLTGSGAVCVIDFSFSVLKTPASDQNPSAAGIQTAQATAHTQVVSPFSASSAHVQALDTSKATVGVVSTPAIASTASPGVALGGKLSDTATVSGLVNPLGGATIDFHLYGPDDATCSAAPAFSNLDVPYPVAGGPVTSVAFAPVSTGTYRWVASYSGDGSNPPVAGACGAAGETAVVTTPSKRSPSPGDRDKDGVRDAIDRCPSVAGDMKNGCPSLLNADVRGVWKVNDLLSKLVSLSVRAPVGSRVELTCKGRRGACAFATKVIKKTTARTTGLTRDFGATRILPAGTRITVKVMKARKRGTYERLLTRAGRKLPSVADRCLSATGAVQGCP
ncbi:MAG TPA: hypothetical protein VHZ31_02195 [Solirubrobacteraceae bacterium]|nr:hypothetical protein [Solirubrobacteraceae bacterium]